MTPTRSFSAAAAGVAKASNTAQAQVAARIEGGHSFSEINLGSDKLGKTYADRNAKLCTIITRIAEGLAEFSTDSDNLGDAYEYLIGQFAACSGKKAGEFYTPPRISDILSAIVTLDSQEPKTGKRKHLARAVFARLESENRRDSQGLKNARL